MNHEAEKLVYPTTREEEAAVNAAFDGFIEEIFACPSCGWIASRREDAEVSD